MAIKSVPREPVKFVPTFGGNRDEEEEDSQTWVMISPLSRAESDKYTKQTKYNQKKGSKGEWESNALVIQKKQFTENVVEVHNYVDCESGEEITDIAQFYNSAPHAVIEEILDVILDSSQLEDEERKN